MVMGRERWSLNTSLPLTPNSRVAPLVVNANPPILVPTYICMHAHRREEELGLIIKWSYSHTKGKLLHNYTL